MPASVFNIPNEADATFSDQAEPDSNDFKIMMDALAGSYVATSGNKCAVTAQSVPDGTVDVASGAARVAGTTISVSTGDVSVISGSANGDASTATAAHASLPRFSLVVVNTSAQLGVVHGTPATNAVFPTWSDTQMVLAAVYVPPTETAVESSHIIDKRVLGHTNSVHLQDHTLSGSTHTGTLSVTQGLGKPQALTGAISATNYVGAVASGTPASGTFAVGDFAIVHTGGIVVCTSAGTPGTWTAVSGSSSTTFLSSAKWGTW